MCGLEVFYSEAKYSLTNNLTAHYIVLPPDGGQEDDDMKTIIRNVEAYDVIQVKSRQDDQWEDLMTLRTPAEIAEAKSAVRTGWTGACGHGEYRIRAGSWIGDTGDGILYSKGIVRELQNDREAEMASALESTPDAAAEEAATGWSEAEDETERLRLDIIDHIREWVPRKRLEAVAVLLGLR